MTGMDANPVPGSPVSEVRFTAERVLLTLQDGRTLAAPLSWVGPRVLELSDADRAAWTPTPDGRGVNWPAAGQDSADGALNVWTLEEDALYSAALDRLSAADWDATALDARSRALVALWRLGADGFNGGLLQFLGNWGVDEVRRAREALAAIGATATLAAVDDFWSVVGPPAASEAVSTMADLHAAFSPDDVERLDALDEAFWAAAEELPRAVTLHLGPAPRSRLSCGPAPDQA